MQQKICDSCGVIVQDSFAQGWAHFFGTDALGQHRTRDFCPRCSAVIQLAIGELQKKLGGRGAADPGPAGAGERSKAAQEPTLAESRYLLGERKP